MALLEINGIDIAYGKQVTVKDCTITLDQAEICSIVGESGSGKTTVIRAVLGLLPGGGKVTKGDIIYDGRSLLSLNAREWRKLRGHDVSMIFQDSGAMMNQTRLIGKSFVEYIRTHEKISKKDAWKKGAEMLGRMRLPDPDRIMHSYPFQLSGGMRQRVGIAMGIMQLYAQSHQWEYMAIAGLCWTVAVFDFLLITMAKNRDPSKASPAVFPLVVFMLVMLILGPFLTVSGVVQYFKAENNVSYAVKKDAAIVRRVYGGDETVVLADSYKDAPVTAIEKQACFGRENMKTIVFPVQLREIRANAFQDCKGLTELELPDGLEEIERNAFLNM